MTTVEQQPHPRFLAGDPILDRRYIVAHRDGRTIPVVPAETVDTGGAGTVYRVKCVGFRDRALKILTMQSRPEDPQKATIDYQATFEREQRLLDLLSHGNIVRLHEYGTDLQHNGRRWKYHITEWVDGRTLLQEMGSSYTTGQQCYTLISQVLLAVRYIHGLGVAHGDIKHENIKCHRLSDETLQPVLLDFGSAQLFGEKAKDAAVFVGSRTASTSRNDAASDPERLLAHPPFATTDKLLHPDLADYRNKPVATADRDIIFPFHDIFSIGVLLKEFLTDHVVKQKLESELGEYGMRGMRLMIDRLVSSSPKNHYYKTIGHVGRDWEKLRPGYVAPAGVPELGVAAEYKYFISTSIGRAVITPRLNYLTSHKLFRRISDIPQLEMLRLEFLGATHTRAEHSALVLRNAQYYLSHLLNDPVFRLLVEPHELEATLILALLHDVGHYQLSHLFEDHASEQKTLRSDLSRREQAGIHDQWGRVSFDIPSDDDLFMAVYDHHLHPDELKAKYGPESMWRYGEVVKGACKDSTRRLRVDFQEAMGQLTQRHFSEKTYDTVVAIHESVYRRKATLPQSHIVLGGILSSDLDANKVAHLMLDSSETGVRFGQGIDLDQLLGALRSPSPGDIDSAEAPLLGISKKGISAAESVLTARKLMHESVYWSKTNRAIMAMAKYSITRLLRAGELDFPEFLKETFFAPYMTALNSLHRLYGEKIERRHPGPIAHMLDGEWSIHQELSLFDAEAEDDKGTAEYLLGRTVFEVAALEDDLTREVSQSPRFASLQVAPGDILIDVPVKDRSGHHRGPVLVYERNTNGPGIPLEAASPIAEVLMDTHTTRSRVCRVFISRRLRGSIADDRLKEHVRDFLAAKASPNEFNP